MTTVQTMPHRVFKICSIAEWSAAITHGAFVGSSDDQRDGYIHLSTAAQAAETATKYFSHRNDLLLIAFATPQLGAQLRWEPSRGGALFPHLYAVLPTAAALGAEPLRLDRDGTPDVASALVKLATANPSDPR
jgi:uncharacterized protein (DUF952 family)